MAYVKKGKGLDLGAEPPRVNICWVPPPPGIIDSNSLLFEDPANIGRFESRY